MTVAFDAELDLGSFTTTSPDNTTFTPVGTPRGILVGIAHGTDSTDHITGVTYGGVAMARIDTAADAVSEAGRAYLYFLGASIPTGAQTVAITHDAGVTVKWAAAASVTAAVDTEIVTFAKLEGDQADPQIALDTGATTSLRFSILYSGRNVVGDNVALTDVQASGSSPRIDFGNFVAIFGRQTSAASSGSFTIGYTTLIDDVAMIAAAVQEVSGATTVTPAVIAVTAALPTPAILAAAKVTPTVIAAAAALPTPAALAAAKVTPTVIAATAALPTPTIQAAAKVTPTVIAAVAALPTPTILAASKVTPTVIAATVTLPTPTIVVASTVVSPAVIATTVSLPTPTVIVPALVTPATIAATAALPTPTIAAAALVAPAVIPTTVTLPTPTIVGPAVTVSPAVIAATVSLPTPTILAAVLVTPSTIAVVVGLPTPTVIGETTVMPATILVTVTFPGPTVILGAIKFWTVNPVAYAANPAGYDPIVGDDTPPLW